jgi:pyruvate kinase
LGTPECISCSYKSLPTTVKVGSIMFVADGSLTLEVTEIGDVSQISFKLIIFYRLLLWQDALMGVNWEKEKI